MADSDLDATVRDYLARVRAGDAAGALTVVGDALDSGVTGERVIEEVLAPAQAAVGRGWQEGRWSIAMEHRASAITESALETVLLRSNVERGARSVMTGGSVVVLCAEGEWHTLPARMAAAVMRLRGLDVTFIGPSLPAEEIPGFLGANAPAVVAVSCALSFNLVGAWRSITAVRQVGAHVLAGGRGFGPHGIWAGLVGADEWASDFASGAERVVGHDAREVTLPRPGTGDPMAVAEVVRLRRTSVGLVERILDLVLDADVAAEAPEGLVTATRRDIESIVGAVASSVLVGDGRVVESHVEWLEPVVTARDLPLTLVSSALGALVDQLPDGLPLTRAMVEAGYRHCTQVWD